MQENEIETFISQLAEDFDIIKEEYKNYERYNDDDYVFNRWVLSKLFLLDDDLIQDYIVDESGDKEIDCYYRDQDHKELFIIQNKYYMASKITLASVTKFSIQSLQTLQQGNYKNKELQKAYNEAIKDDEYKIHLYLYSMQSSPFLEEIETYSKKFNRDKQPKFELRLFNLNDIFNIYYRLGGFNSLINNGSFQFTFKNIATNKQLDLSAVKSLNNEHFKAKYVAISVLDVYELIKAAKSKAYDIFDKNIRNYLGANRINNSIISTLKDSNERKFFFYYNNGITLACQSKEFVSTDVKDLYRKGSTTTNITLFDPQIINGCQTVNAIYDVMSNEKEEDTIDYKDTFVLLKLLDFNVSSGAGDSTYTDLYNKIVECTNNQNAVKPSDFVRTDAFFQSIQSHFKKLGVFLEVKRSDKNTFKHINKSDKIKYMDLLATIYNGINDDLSIKDFDKNVFAKLQIKDILFSLEKMIIILMAIKKGGHAAYTKKSEIFNVGSEYFNDISLKLSVVTNKNLIRMYILYIILERLKKKLQSDINNEPSEILKNMMPICVPYYFFSFLGHFLGRDDIENDIFDKRINSCMERLFSCDKTLFVSFILYFSNMSSQYIKTHIEQYPSSSYNTIIKSQIEKAIFEKAVKKIDQDWYVYRKEEFGAVQEFIKSFSK